MVSDKLEYKAKALTGMKNIINNRKRTIYQVIAILDFCAPNNKAPNTSPKVIFFILPKWPIKATDKKASPLVRGSHWSGGAVSLI